MGTSGALRRRYSDRFSAIGRFLSGQFGRVAGHAFIFPRCGSIPGTNSRGEDWHGQGFWLSMIKIKTSRNGQISFVFCDFQGRRVMTLLRLMIATTVISSSISTTAVADFHFL